MKTFLIVAWGLIAVTGNIIIGVQVVRIILATPMSKFDHYFYPFVMVFWAISVVVTIAQYHIGQLLKKSKA